jgi:hypothetical protein
MTHMTMVTTIYLTDYGRDRRTRICCPALLSNTSTMTGWRTPCLSFKINPGSAIYVEEWMALKDDGRLAALTAEHQAKEQEAQVDKGCKIQSLKHSTHHAHTGLGEQTLLARAAQDISCIPEYLHRKLTDRR